MEVLVASLARVAGSDERVEEAVRELSLRTRDVSPGGEIVRAGTQPTECCLVVDGFAARAQHLLDGSRQLDQIHIQGDFIDLHSLHLRLMDHSVVALGPCRVAYLSRRDIVEAMAKSARLTWSLWQATILDSAIARTWMSCLGRKRAHAALAHLVCELYNRLQPLGLTTKDAFLFPATQVDLADMLGLTPVHVNRTLAKLREDHLLEWSNREVRILDRTKLEELAAFDDNYLMRGRPMPSRFCEFENRAVNDEALWQSSTDAAESRRAIDGDSGQTREHSSRR
jgi:CRP-like cAMP-binding protein